MRFFVVLFSFCLVAWSADAEFSRPNILIIVADGLGFTSNQWQRGDIFFQRFAFEQTGDYLETGLYDYLSGEKLPVENGGAEFVRLLPVPK